MEKRNLSFDALKGIAAFLVVVGHICMGLMQMNNEVILHDIIYSFHMPLFIFVTGFFLPKALNRIERISEAISFLRDKAVRLLIPLMFIPTLYFYVTNGSWDNYIKILVGPHWFTYVLFSLYVWVLTCYLIGRKVIGLYNKRIKYADISVLVLSAFILHGISSYAYSINSYYSNGLLLYKIRSLYPFLLLGYAMGNYDSLNRVLLNKSLRWIYLSSYILMTLVHRFYGGGTWIDFIRGASAVLLLYNIILLWTPSRGRTRMIYEGLSYMGRISLPIYFVHYFFLPKDIWLLPVCKYLSGCGEYIRFMLQIIISVGLGGIVLIPTIIAVQLSRTNRYLRMLLYGESC